MEKGLRISDFSGSGMKLTSISLKLSAFLRLKPGNPLKINNLKFQASELPQMGSFVRAF
jgi:hypothetical protein